MKTLLQVRNITITALGIIFLLGCITEVHAQRHARRAKERIQQLKLIKLLDILELDEKNSEKFIAKYNAFEDKLEENKKQMEFAMKELEISIQRGDPKEKINDRIENLIKIDKKQHFLLQERFDIMKPLLDESQYAKFILFEYKFPMELQRMLIDRRKRMQQRWNPGGGPPEDMSDPPGKSE